MTRSSRRISQMICSYATEGQPHKCARTFHFITPLCGTAGVRHFCAVALLASFVNFSRMCVFFRRLKVKKKFVRGGRMRCLCHAVDVYTRIRGGYINRAVYSLAKERKAGSLAKERQNIGYAIYSLRRSKAYRSLNSLCFATIR